MFGDRGPVTLLLRAAWVGLVVGLLEVGILAARQLLFDEVIHAGRDFVWMTPLAEVLLFVVVGAVLAAASLVWRRVAAPAVIGFVFAFLGLLALVLFLPRLHVAVLVALAAVLAAGAARLLTARLAAFDRLVRRTVLPMAGVVLLLGACLHAILWVGERRALGKLPAAPARSPNVLLIVLDTVRAENMSLYGYARPTTPELARFASGGVVFERALAPAPWTLPSHATLFTGRWPHDLSVTSDRRLDERYPTLAEAFRSRGYRTAGFVANAGWVGYEHGLDRGFTHYEDYPVNLPRLLGSTFLLRLTRLANQGGGDPKALGDAPAPEQELAAPRPRATAVDGGVPKGRQKKLLLYLLNKYGPDRKKAAPVVNRQLLDWLEEGDERPFFAFLNYMETHDPYSTPQPFDGRFGPTRGQRLTLRGFVNDAPTPPDNRQVLWNAYDTALAYLDHHLGRLFDELGARGLLDDTLVIVTSDHGEQLGEHGRLFHGNSLYIQLLHVPLIVRFPARVPADVRVAEPVSLRDLAVTLVDVAGLEPALPLPGTSLAGHWQQPASSLERGREALLSEFSWGRPAGGGPVRSGHMRSLVVGQHHYIQHGTAAEELYDLESDPSEERDLTSTPAGQALLPAFRSRLGALVPRAIAESAAPRTPAHR
jgi:arylsulfatase A-like enzyme